MSENENDFIIMRCGYNLALNDFITIIDSCNSKKEIIKKIREKESERFPDLTENNSENVPQIYSATIEKYYNKEKSLGVVVTTENDIKKMYLLNLDNGIYTENDFDVGLLTKYFNKPPKITKFELKELFEVNLEKILENFEKMTV